MYLSNDLYICKCLLNKCSFKFEATINASYSQLMIAILTENEIIENHMQLCRSITNIWWEY